MIFSTILRSCSLAPVMPTSGSQMCDVLAMRTEHAFSNGLHAGINISYPIASSQIDHASVPEMEYLQYISACFFFTRTVLKWIL